jgi:eukaryotic-like serine/threonine-protein kinase
MLAPDTFVQQRYRVVRLIGQGRMGAVYQAVDQRLGNLAALKQTLAGDATAERAAGLRHPEQPKVIDYFTDESGQFLVMEFIPGNDLATMLAARGGRQELPGQQQDRGGRHRRAADLGAAV